MLSREQGEVPDFHLTLLRLETVAEGSVSGSYRILPQQKKVEREVPDSVDDHSEAD